MDKDPMPVIFAGHGNPMNAIEDTRWSRGFKALGEAVPRPEAIIAISAHWYGPGTHVTGTDPQPTIHDFGGFPEALFRVQYPARGDPTLAQRTATILSDHRTDIRMDWGLDHGTWSVLRHMFPNADIPTIQLSIDATAPAETHWSLGEALGTFRHEGVLILGSGNLVHNLPNAFYKMRTGRTDTESWATDFDAAVASALDGHDAKRLRNMYLDETGRLAHPTPDHYLPILYCAAAAGAHAEVSFPVEGFDMGDVSMRNVVFV